MKQKQNTNKFFNELNELQKNMEKSFKTEFDNHPNKEEIIEYIEMQQYLHVFNKNIKSQQIKEKARELFLLLDKDVQKHMESVFKTAFSKLEKQDNKSAH